MTFMSGFSFDLPQSGDMKLVCCGIFKCVCGN